MQVEERESGDRLCYALNAKWNAITAGSDPKLKVSLECLFG
jgi:hypothetical protein